MIYDYHQCSRTLLWRGDRATSSLVCMLHVLCWFPMTTCFSSWGSNVTTTVVSESGTSFMARKLLVRSTINCCTNIPLSHIIVKIEEGEQVIKLSSLWKRNYRFIHQVIIHIVHNPHYDTTASESYHCRCYHHEIAARGKRRPLQPADFPLRVGLRVCC